MPESWTAKFRQSLTTGRERTFFLIVASGWLPMHIRLRLLPVIALAIAWLSLAPPVAADCEPAGPVAEALRAAPVAFVGTVVAVEGPAARFAVAEIWAGEVGAQVEVRGLSERSIGRSVEGPQGSTEDDRHWTNGATYLVVPWVEGSMLRDSICTATTEWSDDLAVLRPADATIVASQAPASAGPPVWILAIAVATVALAAGSALAFRRH